MDLILIAKVDGGSAGVLQAPVVVPVKNDARFRLVPAAGDQAA